MSWKSLVTAGLLCAVATPVFAAPTISMGKNTTVGTVSNNYLDTNGNWVWQISLAQSNPAVDLPDPDGGGPQGDPPAGSPLGAELGFTVSASGVAANPLISAAVTDNVGAYDKNNPGNVIFGWETLTALGGTGACDSATPGNCPVGLQVEPAAGPGSDGNIDEVFSALGSVDYLSDNDGKAYIHLVTRGPNTGPGGLNPSITVTGSYGGGNNMGRIAELNPAWDPSDNNPPISLNYDTYNNVFSRSVIAGDLNLDGDVTITDSNTLLANFFGPTTGMTWMQGNLNNQADGDITITDLNTTMANFFVPGVPVGPSDGAGGAAGVPEPATLALAALAGLGLIGLRRRG